MIFLHWFVQLGAVWGEGWESRSSWLWGTNQTARSLGSFLLKKPTNFVSMNPEIYEVLLMFSFLSREGSRRACTAWICAHTTALTHLLPWILLTHFFFGQTFSLTYSGNKSAVFYMISLQAEVVFFFCWPCFLVLFPCSPDLLTLESVISFLL